MGNIHGYNIGIVINIDIWIYMDKIWENAQYKLWYQKYSEGGYFDNCIVKICKKALENLSYCKYKQKWGTHTT